MKTDRDMINQIIDAWESLPGGRMVSFNDVKEWIQNEMTDAIDDARVHIGRKRPDGSNASTPQRRY